MKVKVKSYEIKNKSAPGTKAKNLKIGNIKTHSKIKHSGGIKDNRKYINDPTLSEADKLSRRMALENMKKKSTNKMSKNPKLFSKNADEDEMWDNDPFLQKAKQMGQFDEGLDESSSDDDDDQKKENTEKYFANGLFSQKKPNSKKTLDEIIRDSKVERYEKTKANEKDAEVTLEANEKFRKELRFILPKLGVLAKAKSKTTTFQADQTNYGDMFQSNFETLIYAPRPAKADGKSIKPIPINEKDNEKMASLKIKKLREYLIKEGITNDDEAENFLNETLPDSDLDQSDDNEESEESICKAGERENESIESTGEAEESENESEGDNEHSNELDESDESLDSAEIEESSKINTNQNEIKDLKKLILQSNKSTKRKLEDTDEPSAKKYRVVDDTNKNGVDSNKNEVDCFRAILQMADLRKDAMLKLANEMTTIAIDEKNFSRRLILAYLFQQALKSDLPNSYSPELIGFVRFFLANATKKSSTWLSLQKNAVDLEKSNLLNVCSIHEEKHKSDQSNVVVSSIFHLLHLLISIINCNRHLTNKRALFLPFGDIVETLPTDLYPSWLIDKIDEVIQAMKAIRAEADPPMLRMKKVFHIVELLEPNLEDKYDPKKNLTKALKDKVKKETKSLKKEIKLKVKHEILQEIAESKKQSEFRKKKTMEIMNGLSSR